MNRSDYLNVPLNTTTHNTSARSEYLEEKPYYLQTLQSDDCLKYRQMQKKIMIYKEKAHQSFMQTIQLEQLHAEQLDNLRNQMQQKINLNEARITELEKQLKQAQFENKMLQNNYKQHEFQLADVDFSLQNIEAIGCGEESKLDQSILATFKELVTLGNEGQQMSELRKNILFELGKLSSSEKERGEKVSKMVSSLFDYLSFLSGQMGTLQQRSLNLQKELDNTLGREKKCLYKIDRMEKDNKFMSERVKKLAQEKIANNRKIQEFQNKKNHIKLRKAYACHTNGKDKPKEQRQSLNNEEQSIDDMNEFLRMAVAKEQIKNGRA